MRKIAFLSLLTLTLSVLFAGCLPVSDEATTEDTAAPAVEDTSVAPAEDTSVAAPIVEDTATPAAADTTVEPVAE